MMDKIFHEVMIKIEARASQIHILEANSEIAGHVSVFLV